MPVKKRDTAALLHASVFDNHSDEWPARTSRQVEFPQQQAMKIVGDKSMNNSTYGLPDRPTTKQVNS